MLGGPLSSTGSTEEPTSTSPAPDGGGVKDSGQGIADYVPRRTKSVPPLVHMDRPFWGTMENSHDTFMATGAVESKLRPYDRGRYTEFFENGPWPAHVTVFTHGVSAEHQAKPTAKVPAPSVFSGYTVSQDELGRLATYGDVINVGKTRPRALVMVEDRESFLGIAGLPFVYAIQLPRKMIYDIDQGPLKAGDSYTLTLIQEMQKTDETWASPDQDDGLVQASFVWTWAWR